MKPTSNPKPAEPPCDDSLCPPNSEPTHLPHCPCHGMGCGKVCSACLCAGGTVPEVSPSAKPGKGEEWNKPVQRYGQKPDFEGYPTGQVRRMDDGDMVLYEDYQRLESALVHARTCAAETAKTPITREDILGAMDLEEAQRWALIAFDERRGLLEILGEK